MTEERNSSVGERLLDLRNKKGMTQEDLADYLYVSRQSVSKWELNKTLPDVEKLTQLSDLYEVTLDYIVKGVVIVEEDEMDSPKVTEEKELDILEENESNVQASLLERMVYRIVFLMAMLASGILCICALIFSVGLVSRHTFSVGEKQQDVTYVDRIYEQYTLADVTLWDDEWNFHTEKVWLDVSGVREGDYIGYYYEDDKSPKAMFKYYIKTLILPVVVTILLMIFTIIFWMGFRSYGGKKKR